MCYDISVESLYIGGVVVARPNKRKPIVLTPKEETELREISVSRTAAIREVERAKIILLNQSGLRDLNIARNLKIHRRTVKNCLDKCVMMGVRAALDDLPRPGAPREITDDEKVWILNLACKKPLELGYSFELWTISLLVNHIHKESTAMGLPSLANLSRSKLWTILDKAEIKPHKIKYYLEKRDPEFDEKMAQVLCVYKEVEIINKESAEHPDYSPDKITISYDEKPGIQALGNKSHDLAPEPGKHPCLARDPEYVRHGTLSFLAGIDLHSGKIIANVSETHKSSDFIDLLEKIDGQYPSRLKIRLILDNVSSHISKETKRYLETVPNRFEFVFTPKHGSWLNLIEIFFSKMARTFLRGIRVISKDDLKARIEAFIETINSAPVIFRWKYKMEEVTV